ncbi:hypothetical protein DQQ10_25945 [Pseudochryseolinea flava]|uniref:Uncharacterized protein n=1 Tax=Pseudochryseolinea flava TaxID=2059302 RepID=A0A364XWX7_9BACT|nr:hypothetical protein DQQ10_25945 [Pseudochryseolinea flava]
MAQAHLNPKQTHMKKSITQSPTFYWSVDHASWQNTIPENDRRIFSEHATAAMKVLDTDCEIYNPTNLSL